MTTSSNLINKDINDADSILITKCTRATQDNLSHFSFAGYFKGLQVRTIIMKSHSLKFYYDQTYIIRFRDIEIKDGIMYGLIIKRKTMGEINARNTRIT